MRTVATALVTLGLALGTAAPAEAASKTRTCKLPPVDGAGFYGLKVNRTTCATGKALIRQISRGRTVDVSDDGRRMRVKVAGRNWTCRTTYPSYEQSRTTCSNRSARAWLRSGA